MSDLCNSPTSTGHSCGYPPNACPLHVRVSPPHEEEPVVQKFDPDSLKALAESAIGRLREGAIGGLEAVRWLRAIRAFLDMPLSELDRDRILAEVELRGVVSNGFPPRNDEEWELAREVFDADAIQEFHRWEKEGRGW